MLLATDRPIGAYLYEAAASVETVSGVVDWAHGVALRHPELPSASVNALIVCLHELAANVALHGRRGDRAPMMRIGLQIHPDQLSLSIEDNAGPFDPTREVPDFDGLARPQSGEGLGVRIVRGLVGGMLYDRIGDWNRVRLEFALLSRGSAWLSQYVTVTETVSV